MSVEDMMDFIAYSMQIFSAGFMIGEFVEWVREHKKQPPPTQSCDYFNVIRGGPAVLLAAPLLYFHPTAFQEIVKTVKCL